MLTLRKNALSIVSVPTSEESIEDFLSKEWLLTNHRGSYACSTIIGCNTRRYHGLLVGSLNPPANRIMALANCLEMVIFKGPNLGKVLNLSTFEFNDKFAPDGFAHLKQFRRDIGVHFDYQLTPAASEETSAKPAVELTKSVYLLADRDTVALVYHFTKVRQPIEFTVRPFVGLRDFHSLQRSYAPLRAHFIDREASDKTKGLKRASGLLVRHNVPKSCELLLSCPAATFEKDPQWWFNFVYRRDKQRGQDFTEDLWTPGFFRCRIERPAKIVLWANLSYHCQLEALTAIDLETVCRQLRSQHREAIAAAKSAERKPGACPGGWPHNGTALKTLFVAAEQFVGRYPSDACGRQGKLRHSKLKTSVSAEDKDRLFDARDKVRSTILAGFPWFADWGRDAFIALPGLLLATGRFEDARSVLINFADAADEGMIPNRFDDYSDTAHFNSIDASLWFVNAAFEYLKASGDSRTFTQQLLPVIRWIVESYHKGTRFGICADGDGLITAGSEQTQLTWMDAKFDGVAFTPRYGKAVEVNALWYSALCRLAQFYTERNSATREHYHSMADKVKAAFDKLFWNEQYGYLNDCILPDGTVDASLRPNQIFAISLPFSPLSSTHQVSVVQTVQEKLLTPYGLRTLNAEDERYRGKYTGPQQRRDQAYHQGTVWPYLIGPFVESYLKVNGFSRKSRKQAAEFIEPLMRHLTGDGCLGQVCEVFDGDAPHKPRGCIAQAWSVAELIRAYLLINS